jgi:hypothetical protein
MLLTILAVLVGVFLFVIFAPIGLELLIFGGGALACLFEWIESRLKALNTQLAWALAGCSVLGAIVLLAYLLRH